MWALEPNGSVVALNSPASPTVHCGREGGSTKQWKHKLNEATQTSGIFLKFMASATD